MFFQEALKCLQNGDVMHREAWTLESGYLKLMPGMQHVWKIVLQPSPNAGNYIFSLEDLTSSDWKKFEMPKEVIAEAA
jgi:hypothetical protein